MKKVVDKCATAWYSSQAVAMKGAPGASAKLHKIKFVKLQYKTIIIYIFSFNKNEYKVKILNRLEPYVFGLDVANGSDRVNLIERIFGLQVGSGWVGFRVNNE